MVLFVLRADGGQLSGLFGRFRLRRRYDLHPNPLTT